MVQTFNSEQNLGIQPMAITYFSSFEEAERFCKESGGKFYDFSNVTVTVNGERAMAAVEHAAK